MARIERITASAYRIPTDQPEADGTLQWDATTLVVVEATAGGQSGIGWSYTDAGAARIVTDHLADAVQGLDALAVRRAWIAATRRIRNLGRCGSAATAVSALDVALWDLKAKLLDQPLCVLLDAARDRVPVYGSGGFTTYTTRQLQQQLAGWAEQGLRMVKMKVGSRPADDVDRVWAARKAIGDDVQLFVDANGAYSRKQALLFAEAFAEAGVRWFEEPVSSDDLEGLRLLRDRGPAGMQIAAGEYGYEPWTFRRMLDAQAVDALQADATRCLGITGFLDVAALCQAYGAPLSAHCAPGVHLHAAVAAPTFVHLEYFHDHVRIERMVFDGLPDPSDGFLAPDRSRPGHGLAFRRADAAAFAV